MGRQWLTGNVPSTKFWDKHTRLEDRLYGRETCCWLLFAYRCVMKVLRMSVVPATQQPAAAKTRHQWWQCIRKSNVYYTLHLYCRCITLPADDHGLSIKVPEIRVAFVGDASDVATYIAYRYVSIYRPWFICFLSPSNRAASLGSHRIRTKNPTHSVSPYFCLFFRRVGVVIPLR